MEQALTGYLRHMGLARRSREVLAAVLWTEAVGPWYARHTTVVKAQDGVITVHCDSAPHAQQLQADSGKILARLNERVAAQLGETPKGPYVREIRATSAFMGRGGPGVYDRREQPAQTPRAAELDSVMLTAEEEQRMAKMAAEIEDDVLRRRFAAALRSHLRLRRWQLAHEYRPCEGCGALLPPGESRCWTCQPPEPPPGIRE
jgi:predicted nucleic acid-binding Zn ribbon protein